MTAARTRRATAATPTPAPGLHTLQSLMWPEPGICTERDLYVRLEGPAGLDTGPAGTEVLFAAGGIARFDTWFNLFSFGKWHDRCGLTDLHLTLSGEGRLAVSVVVALAERSWERVLSQVVTLAPGAPCTLDLGAAALAALQGAVAPGATLCLELVALGPARLAAADWQTAMAPRRTPKIALSITTFRREAAVQASVARFVDFLADNPLADHLHLIVVDNGQSAGIAPGPHVTPIPNENLGGSGGFARGLLAARARGATHCLFMDDDAAIQMQALTRTWTFLAYATDPATAVAGAMIDAAHRWSIWENGATFFTRCRPRHMGTDLRDPGAVMAMELATSGPAPRHLYAGWWFFAFPLDQVTHHPFPFFVRGDDVSFSLANRFAEVSLPGVASVQENFAEKESPLTWYLDLRSHMAHHLSLPDLDIGGPRTLAIAVRFALRNLARMHYDTMAAVNLALEDVMRGPDFFEANADMGQRRADIRALTRAEAWAPADPADLPPADPAAPPPRLLQLAMLATLNGHLIPFFGLFGRHVTLRAGERGLLYRIWGAARITCRTADGTKAYTVRHSKAAALREGWRLARNGLRFLRAYPRLKADWQAAYPRLTGAEFWTARLGLRAAEAPTPTARAAE